MANVDTWKYDPNYHRIADFLGVDPYDRTDFSTAKKIALIADWAGVEGKHAEKAYANVRGLQRKLGVQFVGKPLIDELYKTIRLDLDRQRATKPSTHAKPKEQPAEPGSLIQDVAKAVGQQVTRAIKQTMRASTKEETKTESKPAPEAPPTDYGYGTHW